MNVINNCWCGSMAEHLICNQAVDGSTPFTSSIFGGFPERPKGADCKSVVTDFGGPNPPSPTKQKTTAKAVVFCLVRGMMVRPPMQEPGNLPFSNLSAVLAASRSHSDARRWSRIHPPHHCESSGFLLGERYDGEATDARTRQPPLFLPAGGSCPRHPSVAFFFPAPRPPLQTSRSVL